jgi:hypothetical protein
LVFAAAVVVAHNLADKAFANMDNVSSRPGIELARLDRALAVRTCLSELADIESATWATVLFDHNLSSDSKWSMDGTSLAYWDTVSASDIARADSWSSAVGNKSLPLGTASADYTFPADIEFPPSDTASVNWATELAVRTSLVDSKSIPAGTASVGWVASSVDHMVDTACPKPGIASPPADTG